ncbi:methyltransferase small domain protein, partial [Trifolium pratense]
MGLTVCHAWDTAFDALLQKLQKYVPYESSVTDLYAGAGVIGLSLAAARKCRQGLMLSYRSIKCIEINKESKVSFEKTIERLPATVDSNITWHHADASK